MKGWLSYTVERTLSLPLDQAYHNFIEFTKQLRAKPRGLLCEIDRIREGSHIRVKLKHRILRYTTVKADVNLSPSGEGTKILFNFNLLYIKIAITAFIAVFLVNLAVGFLIMRWGLTSFPWSLFIALLLMFAFKSEPADLFIDRFDSFFAALDPSLKNPKVVRKLYKKLAESYGTIWGGRGEFLLERRIEGLTKQGMSKEDAVITVAAEEGLIP